MSRRLHEEEVLRPSYRVEELGPGGVNGEDFLAEDGLVAGETEHDVLEVVGVRGRHVDQINIRILY